MWAALNDAEVLKACIPGCRELAWRSDSEMDAKVFAQLGPVRATFDTRLAIRDADPPASYTLTGEGKSGAAGFGRGEARVALAEDAGVTVLTYNADLRLGGRLAQVGSRLVEGATRKIADDFFENFATRLDKGAIRVTPPPAPGRPWLGKLAIAAAILVLLALIWWLSR